MRHATTLLACLIVSGLMYITACNLVPAIAPIDWPTEPEAVVEDTCTYYVEQTEPKFIEGYVLFDNPQDSILWRGGLVSSYDLGEVIAHLLPGHPYMIRRTPTAVVVWVMGTNDANFMQTKVWTRTDGAKWYMGWMKQAIMPYGTITADEHLDLIADLPSVDRFNFLHTNYDSLQYIAIADAILGDCYGGRAWADFRFNPFPITTEIIEAYQAAGWDNVLY